MAKTLDLHYGLFVFENKLMIASLVGKDNFYNHYTEGYSGIITFEGHEQLGKAIDDYVASIRDSFKDYTDLRVFWWGYEPHVSGVKLVSGHMSPLELDFATCCGMARERMLQEIDWCNNEGYVCLSDESKYYKFIPSKMDISLISKEEYRDSSVRIPCQWVATGEKNIAIVLTRDSMYLDLYIFRGNSNRPVLIHAFRTYPDEVFEPGLVFNLEDENYVGLCAYGHDGSHEHLYGSLEYFEWDGNHYKSVRGSLNDWFLGGSATEYVVNSAGKLVRSADLN